MWMDKITLNWINYLPLNASECVFVWERVVYGRHNGTIHRLKIEWNVSKTIKLYT